MKNIYQKILNSKLLENFIPDENQDEFNRMLTTCEKFLISINLNSKKLFFLMISDGFTATPVEIIFPTTLGVSGEIRDLPTMDVKSLTSQNYIKKLKKLIIKFCEEKDEQ